MKKNLLAILAATSIIVCSCSKENVSQPLPATQTSAAQSSQSVADAATTRVTPAPGNYNVALFVNNTDTSTSEFTDYVFTFKANGVLTAKVGTSLFKGTWEVKNTGTELKLNIDGTAALHQINKSWNVVKMTNVLINLNDPEHGIPGRDVLNFKRIL